ncbi:MAG: DUF5668 domain-containing protein [Bacteroidales bacterium]|nr:DUF5668 domain-containing protein [Bacteroidales bacterium]
MKDCIDKRGHERDNRSFVGLVFLLIGLVLLGKNFDFIPYNISYILFSWQMLLIVIGILLITVKKKSIGGLFMIGIGGIFMWDKLYPFSPMDWKIAWPAVFIFVGTALVISYLNKPSTKLEKPKTQPKKKKSKYENIEFDIDKIEPIED